MHIQIGCVYLSKPLRHTDFSLPPTLITRIALHILEFLSWFVVRKCELFFFFDERPILDVPHMLGTNISVFISTEDPYKLLWTIHPGILESTRSRRKYICLVCCGGNAPQGSLA